MDPPSPDAYAVPQSLTCPRCGNTVILEGSPPTGICSACFAMAVYLETVGGYHLARWTYGDQEA